MNAPAPGSAAGQQLVLRHHVAEHLDQRHVEQGAREVATAARVFGRDVAHGVNLASADGGDEEPTIGATA